MGYSRGAAMLGRACFNDHWLTLLWVAGLAKGDVMLSADGIGFYFIQMKVGRAFERKPEEPRLDAAQLHRQRFSVGGTVEDRPVMLVNLAELPAIPGEQDQEARVAFRRSRRSDCKRPRGRAS